MQATQEIVSGSSYLVSTMPAVRRIKFVWPKSVSAVVFSVVSYSFSLHKTRGVRKFPEVGKEVALAGGGKGVNKSNWLADRPQGRPGTAGLCVNKVLRGIAFGFTSWTS